MLGRRVVPPLLPGPQRGPAVPVLGRRRCQQEQLVAALRVGSRHRGQLHALPPAPLGRGGAGRAAAAAAAQVHGSA